MLLASLVLVAACGGAPPRPSCAVPEQGRINFISTDRMNPDESGRPLPTVVRLYQLSSLGNLEQASFEQIWRSPSDTLADTLLGVEEVTLYPDRTVRWPFERNDEARFLVAVAIVRRPMGESWRSVIQLPLPSTVLACGAAASDDEDEEAPASVPIVDVVVDDYRVDASLRMVRATDPCAGALGCLGDRARDSAESAGSSAAENATPDAPSTPSTDAPSLPSPN